LLAAAAGQVAGELPTQSGDVGLHRQQRLGAVRVSGYRQRLVEAVLEAIEVGHDPGGHVVACPATLDEHRTEPAQCGEAHARHREGVAARALLHDGPGASERPLEGDALACARSTASRRPPPRVIGDRQRGLQCGDLHLVRGVGERYGLGVRALVGVSHRAVGVMGGDQRDDSQQAHEHEAQHSLARMLEAATRMPPCSVAVQPALSELALNRTPFLLTARAHHLEKAPVQGRVPPASSGWNDTASRLPCRTATGWPSTEARTSTSSPASAIPRERG
jgi:hypothetical protein